MSRMIWPASGLSAPKMILSGFIQSLTAEPSLRNSGLETTSKGMFTLRFCNVFVICCLTKKALPTGTVDLFTMTRWLGIWWAIWATASERQERSQLPSAEEGVGTQRKQTLALLTPYFQSVVKCRRPLA